MLHQEVDVLLRVAWDEPRDVAGVPIQLSDDRACENALANESPEELPGQTTYSAPGVESFFPKMNLGSFAQILCIIDE